MNKTRFEWGADKDAENLKKHGVSFFLAQYAFADPSSLSNLKEIGCKSAWTVHISPLFWSIE